jgi:fructose-1,6-bisphosphatase I
VFWFSEDNEELIVVPPGKADKYCVAFNPLDGSSNIDYHVSVYMRKPGSSGTVKDLIRSGMGCFCAGYDAYCSAAEIVFTFQGGNVHGFSLESTIGELFTHVKRWFSPKDRGEKIYFANEGNAVHCDQPIRVAVEHFKFGDKPHFARYLGSIVTDIHRTILCGGSRQRVIFDSCMEVSPWYLQVLSNGRITSHKQMLDAHEIIHIYHSRDTVEII